MILSSLLLLSACVTTVIEIKDGEDTARPDTDADTDTDTDADTDTDTEEPVLDADGDGWEGPTGDGDDCDDTDTTVFPGAYDRPNDGLDADCDGADRTTDAVVVDGGATTETSFDHVLRGAAGLDVALLLDTTCSMAGPLAYLDVTAIERATDAAEDARWSFSTYQDYGFAAYGSPGIDLPFNLETQMTDELGDVQASIRAQTTRSGADAPEAGMEALYQVLTGAGYDQDCDGLFDVTSDIAPFIGAEGDLFDGASTGSHDSSVSGTGNLGGVGFRADGQPVIVLITDNYLRDPDSSDRQLNGSPGGCLDDAGSSAVARAATERNAWIVGILVNWGTLAEPQLADLADLTGRYVDIDGDGRFDDAPIYQADGDPSVFNGQIARALDHVAAAAGAVVYDSVEVVVQTDPYGLVASVTPSWFSDYSPGDTLSFDLALTGVTTDEPIVTTVVLAVVAEGTVLDTIEVAVEVAPTGPG